MAVGVAIRSKHGAMSIILAVRNPIPITHTPLAQPNRRAYASPRKQMLLRMLDQHTKRSLPLLRKSPTCWLRFRSHQCQCALMRRSGRHTKGESSRPWLAVAHRLTMQCRQLATIRKAIIGLSATVGVLITVRMASCGLSMAQMCVESLTRLQSSQSRRSWNGALWFRSELFGLLTVGAQLREGVQG